nr:metallo-hydrolase/oxidoreductase superfamily protein [Tanacetum cinerariifolium]
MVWSLPYNWTNLCGACEKSLVLSCLRLMWMNFSPCAECCWEFSVDEMPTFLFLKNGEVVDKIVGADKEGLARIIMKHAAVAAAYVKILHAFVSSLCSATIFWHKYGFLFLFNCLQECYVKRNRRNREDTILKGIEAGSNTLFDIVAYTYADVDCAYWIPAASV